MNKTDLKLVNKKELINLLSCLYKDAENGY